MLRTTVPSRGAVSGFGWYIPVFRSTPFDEVMGTNGVAGGTCPGARAAASRGAARRRGVGLAPPRLQVPALRRGDGDERRGGEHLPGGAVHHVDVAVALGADERLHRPPGDGGGGEEVVG